MSRCTRRGPLLPECILSAGHVGVCHGSGFDRLDTGEYQARLPGDVGAVRDQEVPQPPIMAPVDRFNLTSPEETSHTQPAIPFGADHGGQS